MSTFRHSAQKDAKQYYDNYSYSYEEKRNKSYHKLIDEIELDLLKKYCSGKRVLDAGCGPGGMLSQIKKVAQSAYGIDLSGEMLKFAQKKDLKIIQGTIEQLPFKENTFDVIYSFKVLPHVFQIEKTISDMAKLIDQNGRLILGFYNPHSIRYLIKILKRPSRISDTTSDDEIFTRYDSYRNIIKITPGYLEIEAMRGIRIFTLFSFVHDIPILSALVRFLERLFSNTYLKYFAGFFIVVLRYKEKWI